MMSGISNSRSIRKLFARRGNSRKISTRFLDCLRATRPADVAQPVLAPGDPEHLACEKRSREGIPVPRSLADQVEAIARKSGAQYFFGDID